MEWLCEGYLIQIPLTIPKLAILKANMKAKIDKTINFTWTTQLAIYLLRSCQSVTSKRLGLSRAGGLSVRVAATTELAIATTTLSSALHEISVWLWNIKRKASHTLPVLQSLGMSVSRNPEVTGQSCNLLVDTGDLATSSVAFLVDIRYCTVLYVSRLTYTTVVPAIGTGAGIDGASCNEGSARSEGGKNVDELHFERSCLR